MLRDYAADQELIEKETARAHRSRNRCGRLAEEIPSEHRSVSARAGPRDIHACPHPQKGYAQWRIPALNDPQRRHGIGMDRTQAERAAAWQVKSLAGEVLGR
jgi:hypothetical protein